MKSSLLSLGLSLLLVAGSAHSQQAGPPPAPVEVAPAELELIAPLLWTPASVVSRNDARIAADQEGRVVFLAEIGDRIEVGGVLAKLDDKLLQLAVEDAKANLGRIQARLDYARVQEQRLAQLAKQATISNAQADEAAAERRMQEQDLRAAQVALRQAELRLSRTVLRAPFSGTVAERLIAVGEYMGTGMPVLRLVDTAELEVQARAPVSLAGFVAPGSEVNLRVDGVSRREAVRAVVPVGDAASRQFELRIALSAANLPIGAALEVGLPSGEPREVVTVPRDALVLRPGERYVVRVGTDDISERVAVNTGTALADRIEISGAVHAGDRLVVRGAERLQPGQKVRIADALQGESMAAGSR